MSSVNLTWSGDLDLTQELREMLDPKLQRMAEQQVANTNRRLDMGLGIDDKPMPTKADGSKRTLRDTGQMRQSMQPTPIQADSQGIDIGVEFTNQEAARKAAKNHERTPFLGISPADRRALQDLWSQG